jgi:putative CocE/NonD family hydrolase
VRGTSPLPRGVSRLAVAAAAALALAGAARADVTCRVEWAAMRDGTMLATEVYLPGDQAYPVILQRTPYSRSPAAPLSGSACNNAQMRVLAAAGYAALNQDVRGRYRSEGIHDALFQEAEDGYDAVEWAAAQPWSDGSVGMIGGSYVGLTQYQPAKLAPPHLKAIAPLITASDYHDHWTYVNGAFDLWFAQSWMLLTFAGEQLVRNLEAQGASGPEILATTSAWYQDGRARILTDWVWQLPLASFGEFNRTDAPYQALAPYYQDWLAHPEYDAYWATLDLEPRYGDVKVPTLNMGFWYDIFQIGTVRNFQGMQAEGGTAEARGGSKLLMWTQCHACPAGTKVGDIEWGPGNAVDLNALYVRWFDRWLKGIPNGIDEEPAVRIFVMVPPDTGTTGSGFWVEAETYPLPGTEVQKWRLGSRGRANGAGGDGVLTRGVGPTAPFDRFVYDPANPVPTRGGNMCCINDLNPSGPFDQTQIEQREDVLVYTSAPLTHDLAVIGPVRVKLWAETSAPDTDFTAKLVDVHHDGFAQNVLDRLVRARYRWGSKLPSSLVTPGQPYEYTIDLGNTATVFKRGHRIRLEVSSSNFPHYARNQNTGAHPSTDAAIAIAQQKILHDARRQSVLELPIATTVKRP